jgi:hypothetical protein
VANSLLVLVAAAYAAVATAYLEARRRREGPPHWARLLGLLSVAAHLVGLYALSGETGRSPFASGAQSLSFVAFSLAALYVVPPAARDALRTVHVGLGLLSAAAVLAGGLLAAGYLQAYRRVKGRTLEAGEEGPSLTGFERLERWAAALGVLLLAPSLALGLDVALRSEGRDGLMALALLTALLLALLCGAGFLWWRRPRRGALAAWLQVAATLILVISVLVHPLLAGSH